MVYCTVFFFLQYTAKNVPETPVASPPGRILRSTLTGHRALGAACAPSLQALARRLKDTTRAVLHRARRLLPSPSHLHPAWQGRAQQMPKAAGTPWPSPFGSGHWGPRLALPCSRVTRSHLPEEMLGGQGWPQSFGLPQVLQHGQPGVTTASVVEKGGASLGPKIPL